MGVVKLLRQVSEDEQKLLLQYYKKGQNTLLRQRAQAVLLSSRGGRCEDIASVIFASLRVVRMWIKDFNERGFSSLFAAYTGNQNASKLNKGQKEEIRERLKAPPSAYGIPREFWDLPSLKRYVKAEFGVVYESDRSYHYLLEFSNLSFHLPSVFDVRRDERRIEERLSEIHSELKPLMLSEQWEVFAADEARITWESETRRAWLKRGERTVVKVHRGKYFQSFFGALNLKTGKEFLHNLSWQNQETILGAVRALLKAYPRKRICIVWDNAAWHKGKELREALKKNKSLSRLHLIAFPPYAPDCNPQERVWNWLKDKTSNDSPDSFQTAITLFHGFALSRNFTYRIPSKIPA